MAHFQGIGVQDSSAWKHFWRTAVFTWTKPEPESKFLRRVWIQMGTKPKKIKIWKSIGSIPYSTSILGSENEIAPNSILPWVRPLSELITWGSVPKQEQAQPSGWRATSIPVDFGHKAICHTNKRGFLTEHKVHISRKVAWCCHPYAPQVNHSVAWALRHCLFAFFVALAISEQLWVIQRSTTSQVT